MLEKNEGATFETELLASGESKGYRSLCLLEFFMAAVVVDVYFSSLQ